MYRIFDAHSDLFEDIDEKRERSVPYIVRSLHMPKWQTGGCTGGFCPIWVDPDVVVYPMPVEEQFNRILMHMQEEFEETKDIFVPVTSCEQYESAVEQGKHAVFLGTEGLSFLKGDYNKIEKLISIGMREFSLTWNEENEFACGAGGNEFHGLTKAGKECVKTIVNNHALLDLAHASKQTFFDAVNVLDSLSGKPFMVSHANINAIMNHNRNLTDEQLKIIAEHNGVVGISAYGPFIARERKYMTLEKFCDNIEYVADKIGIDHVGVGFDFVDFLDDVGEDEAISYELIGLENISKGQAIASELERRGFRNQEISKVLHDNFMRLVGDVIG